MTYRGSLPLDEIVRRRAAGETFAAIARDCGVSPQAVQSRFARAQAKRTQAQSKPRGRPARDWTGHVFGRRTVVGRAGSAHGQAAWLVRCECGAEDVILAQQIRLEKSVQCRRCSDAARPGGVKRKGYHGRLPLDEIVRRRATGETLAAIGRSYGVSHAAISNVLSRARKGDPAPAAPGRFVDDHAGISWEVAEATTSPAGVEIVRGWRVGQRRGGKGGRAAYVLTPALAGYLAETASHPVGELAPRLAPLSEETIQRLRARLGQDPRAASRAFGGVRVTYHVPHPIADRVKAALGIDHVTPDAARDLMIAGLHAAEALRRQRLPHASTSGLPVGAPSAGGGDHARGGA